MSSINSVTLESIISKNLTFIKAARREARATKIKAAFVSVLVVVVAVGCYLMWTQMNHLDYLSKTMHETDRWAVIRDSKGDIMAVETTDDSIWNVHSALRQNQTAMWIGGDVEEYDSKWEFRFKPETIVVAQFTIEGAQSNIQGISGDLDYWINVWGRETYVLARVVEIHE